MERVTVKATENKSFEVEIVGDIANMLKLPEGSGSSNIDKYKSSVKVVAGARNCLNLLFVAVGLPKVGAPPGFRCSRE